MVFWCEQMGLRVSLLTARVPEHPPWECSQPGCASTSTRSHRHDSLLFWAMGNRNKQKVWQDMRNTSHGCLESEQGLLLLLSSMPLRTLHISSDVHTDLWVRQLLGKAGFHLVLKLCSVGYSLPARKHQRTSLMISLVILHFVADQFQSRSQICDFTAAGQQALYFFPVGNIPLYWFPVYALFWQGDFHGHWVVQWMVLFLTHLILFSYPY